MKMERSGEMVAGSEAEEATAEKGVEKGAGEGKVEGKETEGEKAEEEAEEKVLANYLRYLCTNSEHRKSPCNRTLP